MITGASSVFGILGRPVAHSLSPAMHNAAFHSLGLNAVYVPFAVQNLDQAVQGLRGLNLGGVSVTIPFKEEIIPLLDEVDDRARRIGAVNIVVNRDGRLWGGNTDWQGALAALQDQTELGRPKRPGIGRRWGRPGHCLCRATGRGEVTVTDLDADQGPDPGAAVRRHVLPLGRGGPMPCHDPDQRHPVGNGPTDREDTASSR